MGTGIAESDEYVRVSDDLLKGRSSVIGDRRMPSQFGSVRCHEVQEDGEGIASVLWCKLSKGLPNH